MDQQEFIKQYIRSELGISDEYQRIFSFIDFGNVNRWFDNDTQDSDNKQILQHEKLSIDLEKLQKFTNHFSTKTKIYYGSDPKNIKSQNFSYVIRKIFGNRNFIEKDLQKIKHYLEHEETLTKSLIQVDRDGRNYVEIRKCNFDVEISVDAIKMTKHYDTFCLFSGDSDFAYLNNYLSKKGKKIILIKAGYITSKLRKSVDLVINAQKIKRFITRKEQRPD